MARALLLADKKIHSLELQVKEQAICKCSDIGQNRLFKWLRDKNYLISRKGDSYNTPTQKAMKLGLFKVKERVINEANGSTTIIFTHKILKNKSERLEML